MQDLKKIISHCKEYGFIFPSSEIYDGLSAIYDYGPFGVELKNNIKKYWWKSMVQENENIVGIDSAIFMHPLIWKASGHIDAFNDPLVDNKDSKKRYRADILVEDEMEKYQQKIDKEIKKAEKRFGPNFDLEQFVTTHPRVVKYTKKIDDVKLKLSTALANNNMLVIKEIIDELEIRCPVSGTSNWTDVRQFNLMFDTKIGAVSDDASKLYLRPETAQGIFVNFLNVQKSARKKIPFGIAQIGKAFRNEITPRNFIFRVREFEQMELEYFVEPGNDEDAHNSWVQKRLNWWEKQGVPINTIELYEVPTDELAHYSKRTVDLMYKFPHGLEELEGIANRTDFDLGSHSKKQDELNLHAKVKLNKDSNSKLSIKNNEEGMVVPFVIEPSAGVERGMLAVLNEAFTIEGLPDNKNRIVLKLKPHLAPIKAAVIPLKKNDKKIVDFAQKIKSKLQDLGLGRVIFENTGNIGKSYRKHDEIGTPICITVDFETIENNSVTIRDRDSMQQERVDTEEIENLFMEKIK